MFRFALFKTTCILEYLKQQRNNIMELECVCYDHESYNTIHEAKRLEQVSYMDVKMDGWDKFREICMFSTRHYINSHTLQIFTKDGNHILTTSVDDIPRLKELKEAIGENTLRKEIEQSLTMVFNKISIRKPKRFHKLLEFVIEDVKGKTDWTEQDIKDSLQKWIDKRC